MAVIYLFLIYILIYILDPYFSFSIYIVAMLDCIFFFTICDLFRSSYLGIANPRRGDGKTMTGKVHFDNKQFLRDKKW